MMISVIVPVYNVADFVARCIESILSQTYTDFELILVNDGSTDDSLAVISRYTSDARVVILDKPNGGVSSARNAGIDAARGEVIVFVDGDDTVSPSYLADLAAGVADGCDMVMAAVDVVDEHGSVIQALRFSDDIALEGTDLRATSAQILQGDGCIMHSSPCNKAFLHRLITAGNLRFDESMPYGEDHYFNLQYYLLVKKYRLLNKPNYHYYQRAGVGAMQRFSLTRIEHHLKEMRVKREIIFAEYAHPEEFFGAIAKGIIATVLIMLAGSDLAGAEKTSNANRFLKAAQTELLDVHHSYNMRIQIILSLCQHGLFAPIRFFYLTLRPLLRG